MATVEKNFRESFKEFKEVIMDFFVKKARMNEKMWLWQKRVSQIIITKAANLRLGK